MPRIFFLIHYQSQFRGSPFLLSREREKCLHNFSRAQLLREKRTRLIDSRANKILQFRFLYNEERIKLRKQSKLSSSVINFNFYPNREEEEGKQWEERGKVLWKEKQKIVEQRSTDDEKLGTFLEGMEEEEERERSEIDSKERKRKGEKKSNGSSVRSEVLKMRGERKGKTRIKYKEGGETKDGEEERRRK